MTGKRPVVERFGPRGAAFHARAVKEFELSESEVQLLVEVCRVLDEIDGLNEAVLRDGVTVAGSTGQVRVHPAISEVRQHRLALARLLAVLALPDGEGAVIPTGTAQRAHAAAVARWKADSWHKAESLG